MRYVNAAGVRMSAIGLGTWQFGAPQWGYGPTYAGRDALAITRRALDLGINLIDTAEIYGWGASERIVGTAIAGRRDEVFLATKLLPILPVEPVVSSRAVGSLRRLGTDHVELYQLHWPNPLFPVPVVARQLRKLLDVGLVGHIGVSNFTLEQWLGTEVALGRPVISNQVHYSLAVRNPESELLGWAQRNDRIILAYSPLAQGLLSGRYDGTNTPPGVRSANPLFLPDNITRAAGLLGVLRRVAAAHGATSAQVALAWLIAHPGVVAIPGASSVAQLEANAAAADLELSSEEYRELTEASDGFAPLRGPAAVPARLRRRWGRAGGRVS